MLINSDEVSEYPIGRSARRMETQTMRWQYDWWLNSDFRLLAEKEVRAIAFDLFCVAQSQEPIGTLPNDELLLARLVSVPLEVWQRLMTRCITPLNGWKVCSCGDSGLRLFHPVSLENAKETQNA